MMNTRRAVRPGAAHPIHAGFAYRLKLARELRGLSQRGLAKKSDVSYATIGQIETGANKNPTLDNLVKLADYFGISLDRLIGREIPKELP